jgi:hypothetical protein
MLNSLTREQRNAMIWNQENFIRAELYATVMREEEAERLALERKTRQDFEKKEKESNRPAKERYSKLKRLFAEAEARS